MASPTSAPQSIVLDTNAVLDCWLFDDPRVRMLRQGVEQGRLRWHATAGMLDELGAVLARRLPARWETSRERLLSECAWRRCELTESPGAHACAHGLRCTDPDDQPFLDLALHLGVRWLVSRDRALLRLAWSARRHGLAILAPEHWSGA